MYIHDSLKQQDIIKREGVLKEVILPKEGLLTSDIVIKISTKQIIFREGESIFVIDKQIGIVDEVKVTIFVAGEYIVCQVLKGNIYIKEKDNLYAISDTGTKQKVYIEDESIKWLSSESYYESVSPLIKVKYSLKRKVDAEEYINNLSLDLLLSNEKKKTVVEEDKEVESYMFKLRVVQEFRELGLDEFEFKDLGDTKEQVKEDSMDSYTIWLKERERDKKEKIALRKAEQAYLKNKEGEDIVEEDEYVLLGMTMREED